MCPYSQKVLEANSKIGAPLILRNVAADESAINDLIHKGGKRQVPFLEDTSRGIRLYESLDIIDYLQKHYGSIGTATE